ncbi:MAG TPA: hypothetical protein VK553_12150 [Candidatus Nitrosopolaris rasttigaisensis]|nr:hypothetical protein [Candidatus Nitrosopolaris rasttigaisensis]
MSKKKQIKVDEEKEVKQPIVWIKGAFIAGQRVIQNTVRDEVFLLKLSSINTIVPLKEDDNTCLFYTYKDCCYWSGISPWELRRAIDSFIFQSETHWESYGY